MKPRKPRAATSVVSIREWFDRLCAFDREFASDPTATLFTIKAFIAMDGPDVDLSAMRHGLVLALFRVIVAARADARSR